MPIRLKNLTEEQKRNRKKRQIEDSLYKWLDLVDKVDSDILYFIDNKDISKIDIASDIDKMKLKLRTLEYNIKNY